jgi:CBS domain-containing protein
MLLMDLVNRAPVTVLPEASVLEAARAMRDRNVGSVIVYDEGTVVGILTDRDVVLALADGRFLDGHQRVSELMTRDPVCLESRADVDTGLARMRMHRVRRMPVLNEQGELVGIVSLDDMLMHMGRTLGTAADLVEEEVAAVPGDAWPRCGR